MANPVFNSNNFQSQMRGGHAVDTSRGGPTLTADQLQQMYNEPAATAADTGRMTYNDVILRTTGTLLLVIAGAAVGWITANPILMFGGAIVGLILGLVNAFKREPSPALILAYAVAQGLFLGGLSRVFEMQWPGVATQALLGTLCVFAVTLALFMSGKVRATPKGMKIFMVLIIGYGLFSLVNLGLSMFGVLDEPFGLRSGFLGVAIGLLAIGLAAYSLVIDFTAVDEGVKNGAPRKYSWSAAFGLTVTLIWLYIEILRLIAILRGND
ncbi:MULTISPECIES: Bax inhibitor-1/YccA family protein [Citricoccus]|uniref:Bax inhibitor-1/YccA family protein n=1 Tax=Citricoccus muralis TaxID=169134 RepID=A0ABY8H9N0_9MICC|nr:MULTISPECIES: Bax inhibitor-1/YccA family protein [Citricoccus]WBL19005.1 Bax inhibitor-1/YccA family protein [Citricoccus sp. NR2]WFP17368.1 Bax inhibitor-1/YccA family protein [Citricoccus muralis]